MESRERSEEAGRQTVDDDSSAGEMLHGRHLLLGSDMCLRCRAHERDVLQGGVGCDVEQDGVNPAYSRTLALTPAEQEVADLVGLDLEGAMTLKILALFSGRKLAGKQLVEAREPFERRAVEMVAAHRELVAQAELDEAG